MQNKPRKLAYPTIPDLCHAIRESTYESHRFHEFLFPITESACGINQEKGLLEMRIVNYILKSPMEWAKEMDQLYSLLAPGSPFLTKLAHFANNQFTIDAACLPKCVIREFPQKGTYESRLIGGLRKEVTDSYCIRLWDWFWITMIRAFMNMNLQERRSASQDYEQDEFFYNLSSNFYLGLFYRCLTSLSTQLKERVMNLLHIYLIEEVFCKFEKKEGNTHEQVKYRLKPHYLYLFYILIVTNRSMQDEMARNYFLFLEKIAEYYSSLTALTRNQTVRNILRVWITLTTRSVTVETSLVNKLKHANQKQGWFRLARCPIEQFAKSVDKLNLPVREWVQAQSAKEKIIQLLGKESEWAPSYGMAAILQQLLVLQAKRVSLSYRKDPEEINNTLIHAIQRNLKYLKQEQSLDVQAVTVLSDRIVKRIQSLYQRSLKIETFGSRFQDGRTTFSQFQRRRLVNYTPQRVMNVWEHPLQHNQFYLLYICMYWLANKIDERLPFKNPGEHPRVNLRIFCNPFVFALTIIVLVLFVKYVIL